MKRISRRLMLKSSAPAVLGSAREAFGLHRFLFGSDAPSMAPQVTARFMRDGGLSEAEVTQVLRDNPAQLFGDRLAARQADPHVH